MADGLPVPDILDVFDENLSAAVDHTEREAPAGKHDARHDAAAAGASHADADGSDAARLLGLEPPAPSASGGASLVARPGSARSVASSKAGSRPGSARDLSSRQGSRPGSGSSRAERAPSPSSRRKQRSIYDDWFDESKSHLGMDRLIVGSAEVAHPARAGNEDAADDLPIVAPLCKALDASHVQRAHLARLASAKPVHKAMRYELHRQLAAQQLPASILFCLQQACEADGADGAVPSASAAVVDAAMAAAEEQLRETERGLAAAAPALKESRRIARETLADQLGQAALYRKLQVRPLSPPPIASPITNPPSPCPQRLFHHLSHRLSHRL